MRHLTSICQLDPGNLYPLTALKSVVLAGKGRLTDRLSELAQSGQITPTKRGNTNWFKSDDILRHFAARTPDAPRVQDCPSAVGSALSLLANARQVSHPPFGIVGVYFLFLEGVLQYVGQSTNVVARVAAHCRDKEFDTYKWFECHPDRLDDLEGFYIRLLQPPLNGHGPPSPTFEALKGGMGFNTPDLRNEKRYARR